jgi:hypothetical protein
MADFGGIMRFTYNGAPMKIRAKVELEPTGGSYTAEDNQDGSFDRYYQPMGPKFDVEFVDSRDGVSATSQPWDAIMAGGPYNISIVEDSNKILHSFTGAKFIGRPKIDRLKGIVTGITGQTPVGGYIQTTTA